MDNKLQTMNVNGNLHEAAITSNQRWPEIVNSIVAMHCTTSDMNTVVVYAWPRPIDRRPIDVKPQS